MDAISTPTAFTDRLDRLQVHQFGQVTPGRAPTHLAEANGLAQCHAARELLRFNIQHPIEKFLLAAVEVGVQVAPPEGCLARHRIDHCTIGGGRCRELLQEPAWPARYV